MASLADGGQREQMDRGYISNIFLIFFSDLFFSGTKILNGVLIGGGIAIAIGTSWYV